MRSCPPPPPAPDDVGSAPLPGVGSGNMAGLTGLATNRASTPLLVTAVFPGSSTSAARTIDTGTSSAAAARTAAENLVVGVIFPPLEPRSPASQRGGICATEAWGI